MQAEASIGASSSAAAITAAGIAHLSVRRCAAYPAARDPLHKPASLCVRHGYVVRGRTRKIEPLWCVRSPRDVQCPRHIGGIRWHDRGSRTGLAPLRDCRPCQSPDLRIAVVHRFHQRAVLIAVCRRRCGRVEAKTGQYATNTRIWTVDHYLSYQFRNICVILSEISQSDHRPLPDCPVLIPGQLHNKTAAPV